MEAALLAGPSVRSHRQPDQLSLVFDRTCFRGRPDRPDRTDQLADAPSRPLGRCTEPIRPHPLLVPVPNPSTNRPPDISSKSRAVTAVRRGARAKRPGDRKYRARSARSSSPRRKVRADPSGCGIRAPTQTRSRRPRPASRARRSPAASEARGVGRISSRRETNRSQWTIRVTCMHERHADRRGVSRPSRTRRSRSPLRRRGT